mgnify:CR=1 FL=1
MQINSYNNRLVKHKQLNRDYFKKISPAAAKTKEIPKQIAPKKNDFSTTTSIIAFKLNIADKNVKYIPMNLLVLSNLYTI